MEVLRYTYLYGFRTKAKARDSVEKAMACGEICESEKPEINGYQNKYGETRYAVTLKA